MNQDRINGFGVYFRFITPVLLAFIGTMIITLICGIKDDMKDLKTHFNNHLTKHESLSKELENRLASIETCLRIRQLDTK